MYAILGTMHVQKVFIGGWFQRTTLHLSELWEFFQHGEGSPLLDKQAVKKARTQLGIKQVSRESGPLEYILVETTSGLLYRIYEDGLMVLELAASKNLKKDAAFIKEYYDTKLSKSISLIFSKGAPVPKELANISTILPYIITLDEAKPTDVKKLYADFNEEAYSHLSSQEVEVYRGSGLILINNLHSQELARELIESQIFFREFKTQLHRYLALHRIIWEKIQHIKDRGKMKNDDIDLLREELQGYQKTIMLIDARIAQMDIYLPVRQKIANGQAIDESLRALFQFKFETLLDTHKYIRSLWTMTKNYLDSALADCTDVQQKGTKNALSALQLITIVNVVAAMLAHLGKEALPKFTSVGLIFFTLVVIIAWIINTAVTKLYQNRRYAMKIRSEQHIQ